MKHYTIRFLAKRGCQQAVVDDMARHDAAIVSSTTHDEDCEPGAVRQASFVGKFDPTMGRWGSFMVGAKIVTAATVDPSGMERAMVPGPKAEGGS